MAYVGTTGFDLDKTAREKGWPWVHQHATDKEMLGKIIAVDKVSSRYFPLPQQRKSDSLPRVRTETHVSRRRIWRSQTAPASYQMAKPTS